MLTAEQIELRKKGLGSSDIARILYFDPWQVWAEKTGKSDGVPVNAAMRRGNALEPVIAEIYAERMNPEDVAQGATSMSAQYNWMLATPDYWVVQNPGDLPMILECKAPGFRAGWGEEWTDDIPEYVIVQVQWQMGVPLRHLIAPFCRVGALIGNDHLIYEVERDDELIANLVDIGERFWTKHVLADIPPEIDASESATRYIHSRYPKNHGNLIAPNEQTREWHKRLWVVKSQIKGLDADKSKLENLLKDATGDADGIDGLLTWKKPKDSTKVNWEAIAREAGASKELIEKHTTVKENTRRFLAKEIKDEG